MNTLLKDRNALPVKAGSMWVSSLDRSQQGLVRALIDMTASSVQHDMTHAGHRLSAVPDSCVANKSIKVDLRQIVQFTPDMQQRILTKFNGGYVLRPREHTLLDPVDDHGFIALDSELGVLGDEAGSIIAFPMSGFGSSIGGALAANTTLRPRWLIPAFTSFAPTRLLSLRGELLCGSDFLFSEGILHFFEDPHQLFELPYIPVAHAYKKTNSLFRFPLRTDVQTADVSAVSCYFREAQTPKTFERAIACAAGLEVVPASERLLFVFPLSVGYRYVFENFVLEASYPHTPLTAGLAYEKGQVVGDHIRVTAGGFDTPRWYRNLDWSQGLALDSVCAVKGLTAPDAQRLARTTTLITGSKYHVRIQLDGDEETQEQFWTRVAAAELNSGHYLCDVLGISGQGSMQVNPVDVFFESGLVRNALVVDLTDMPDAAFTARALRFIENEKPVGAAVIPRIIS